MSNEVIMVESFEDLTEIARWKSDIWHFGHKKDDYNECVCGVCVCACVYMCVRACVCDCVLLVLW